MINGMNFMKRMFVIAFLLWTFPLAGGYACGAGPRDAAAELAGICDSLVRGRGGDAIAVAADDGRCRIILRADAAEYETLFEELLDGDAAIDCDCLDDYDSRICYAVMCCRAYRCGEPVSHIVMPLNEFDATKGDIVYPLDRSITDPLLRLIAF